MKSKLFIAFFAGMAMLLTACNDENESTLDINSIEGRTIVEGKISYNSGDAFDGQGGINSNQYTPVSGKTVYFYLQLSSLGDYNGKLLYTTTTNTDGSFSIEVPANHDGIEYSISVESFKAIKSEYDAERNFLVPVNYYFTNTEVENVTAFENIGDYKEIELNNSTKID